jgi:hypothetical protein
MKKKSAADSTIFTMWGKASKAKKIDERSTPSQPESRLQLVNLASKFYATDFSSDELARLPWQLDIYICHVRRDGSYKLEEYN